MYAPDVSFVIPVRNAAAALDRCLRSIAAIADDSVEIIVVDNGSGDDSAAVAARHGARVLVEPARRVGGLRNAGARLARGNVLAFVDADHELGTAWLEACRSVFEDSTVGAAGRLCDAPRPGTWVQRAYDCLRSKPVAQTDVEWLGAGNLAVRRDAFSRAGGFDETVEACEDADLCRAIRECGWRIASVPAMVSIHHGDPASVVAVFRGELWRGRGNIRISLRGPMTMRSLPGVLFPALTLLVVLAAPLLLTLAPRIGYVPLAMAMGVLACLVGTRTAVMMHRGRGRGGVGFLRCAAVAAAYELGRAVSPLVRAPHTTRTGEAVGRG